MSLKDRIELSFRIKQSALFTYSQPMEASDFRIPSGISEKR
jgi:hypothetical protein